MRSIQINRDARIKYEFESDHYQENGLYEISNLTTAKRFAQQILDKRAATGSKSNSVYPGQIYAMSALWDVQSKLILQHIEKTDPKLVAEWHQTLQTEQSAAAFDSIVSTSLLTYPTLSLQRAEVSISDAVQSTQNSNDLLTDFFLRYILGYIANQNPALISYKEIIGDTLLRQDGAYSLSIENTNKVLKNRAPVESSKMNLLDFLLEPIRKFPDSLTDQLGFIAGQWHDLIPDFLAELLISADSIREETADRSGGPGPVSAPNFEPETFDIVNFSIDKDWMPNLVLLAKNTYVWLYQLSKQYNLSIKTLDEIPEEELQRLADAGFSGLWLIGLWERSKASARIKQLCGNPDAIASAYSIYDYRIAPELGGEPALQALKNKAAKYGIRLASDMVPNHMGIDSPWVINHPEWFISLNESPFPSYRFNGTDLSSDDRVGIYLEDHYYTKDDAAVVFKRVDRLSSDTRYIYHGNDGTSMPWNDTAQLNYLVPEVREAVIQTILQVARDFHIIRFDAAMTLAKKHYQRLWFPEPGSGGAIPSRAEHALTKARFNELFPEEFWREVVDRVAKEVPDTLLLAEAFWLMEGYFVRSLGMHRVYNSAFMNMLRDENNRDYRKIIKDTIAFEPEILKRYVNFMNNPDERTAIDQFGRGDKYFGICILMATLPGLPMFGHGQVEGFTEKYGMEFYKPQLEESPDLGLVDRHRHDVFPLLHRRDLFSGVEQFRMYDFYKTDHTINENVYAYSNKANGTPVVVLFNNNFEQTNGSIDLSTSIKSGDTQIEQTIASALGIEQHVLFYVLHDRISESELLVKSSECIDGGLSIHLNGYQAVVIDHLTPVYEDPQGLYEEHFKHNNGWLRKGIFESVQQAKYAEINQSLSRLINPEFFSDLYKNQVTTRRPVLSMRLVDKSMQLFGELFQRISEKYPLLKAKADTTANFADRIRALQSIYGLVDTTGTPPAGRIHKILRSISELTKNPDGFFKSYALTLFNSMLELFSTPDEAIQALREWGLFDRIRELETELFPESGQSVGLADILPLLSKVQSDSTAGELLNSWFSDGQITSYLGVNEHEGIRWFNAERFSDLKSLSYLKSVLHGLFANCNDMNRFTEKLISIEKQYAEIDRVNSSSEYQVDKLLKQFN